MAITPDLSVTGSAVDTALGTVNFDIPISGGTRTGADVIGLVSVWYNYTSPSFTFIQPSVTASWAGVECEQVNVALGLFGFTFWDFWATTVFAVRNPSLTGNISISAVNVFATFDDVYAAGVTFLNAAMPTESYTATNSTGTTGSVTVTSVPSGSIAFAAHGNQTGFTSYNQTTITSDTELLTGYATGSGSSITSTLTQTSSYWAAVGVQIDPYVPLPVTVPKIRTSSGWNGSTGIKMWDGAAWVKVKPKRYHSGDWH